MRGGTLPTVHPLGCAVTPEVYLHTGPYFTARQLEDPREGGEHRQPGEAGQQIVADTATEFGGFVGWHGKPV